jgi:signal transduction histidine kinase
LERICQAIVDRRIEASAGSVTHLGSFRSDNICRDSLFSDEDYARADEPGIGVSTAGRSLALVPIDAGDDRIGLLALESTQASYFRANHMKLLEELVQSLGVGLSYRRLQFELRERVKELTCLYGIAKLVARQATSLNDILKEAVDLLPPGWLYPEIAVARIVVDDHEYTSPGFDNAVHILSSDIKVDGVSRGRVEVGYTRDLPELGEGPFLVEERHLLDTIAGEIAVVIEQEQVEVEKTRLQQQVLHADRLATIGQLAAGVAHELNEPLASILGFAQLSLKDQSLSNQTRQDVKKIVSASLHAREVVRRLLSFARVSKPERIETNLSEVVENGLYFLDLRCAKSGIELTRDLADDIPPVIADPSQILQILTNLIVNSIQAMPDGGKLFVSTRLQDGKVVLAVSDTGIGMTERECALAVAPFYTTKGASQGTGLGLSVVQNIVTSHGGKLLIGSEVGHGSTVTVELPVCTSSQETGASHD